MADIQIDADKAERMISQILRDDKRFLPEAANALAANICRRLSSAMASPTNQRLQGYRIIAERPPGDFAAAVGEKIADVNERVAGELWKLVYDRARDLPATVADRKNW